MDNYPPGATESWAPYNQPKGKICPACGEDMSPDDNMARIRSRIYRWVNYYCDCGYEEINEPDWDEFR